MTISNFKKASRKDDIRILSIIVFCFLMIVWFCTPPGNKFLQVCFWGHNTKHFFAKILKPEEVSEYKYHRNKAVYLAKMEMKEDALKEMDKAIMSIPAYVPQSELESLYRDRAYIRMYVGDLQGALSDFCNSGKISFNDNLKMALLLKENGDYKNAMSYCNAILQLDTTAYAGYACLADLYESFNRPDMAIRVWELAISRKQNNARFYVDLAKLYKSIGDYDKYELYIAQAKQYSAMINEDESLIEDTLHPKVLYLSIKS